MHTEIPRAAKNTPGMIEIPSNTASQSQDALFITLFIWLNKQTLLIKFYIWKVSFPLTYWGA